MFCSVPTKSKMVERYANSSLQPFVLLFFMRINDIFIMLLLSNLCFDTILCRFLLSSFPPFLHSCAHCTVMPSFKPSKSSFVWMCAATYCVQFVIYLFAWCEMRHSETGNATWQIVKYRRQLLIAQLFNLQRHLKGKAVDEILQDSELEMHELCAVWESA